MKRALQFSFYYFAEQNNKNEILLRPSFSFPSAKPREMKAALRFCPCLRLGDASVSVGDSTTRNARERKRERCRLRRRKRQTACLRRRRKREPERHWSLNYR